jgi:ornithine cyclodeaminase/alanine dehydrogenase-like protein (mu-crystallin family)
VTKRGGDVVLYVTDADVRSVLDIQESNEITEELFRQEAQGKVENRPTTELRLPRGVFRLKAGVTANLGTFGYKAYPFGGRYLVFVYDMETGLDGIVESRGLTEVRTGAVSAVALKYMTRPGATTMGIIGTGSARPDGLDPGDPAVREGLGLQPRRREPGKLRPRDEREARHRGRARR